jgi:hypothetical protein
MASSNSYFKGQGGRYHMNNGDSNNDREKGVFANSYQKKFYIIRRAFKIGNIAGTVVLVLFIGKSLAGV